MIFRSKAPLRIGLAGGLEHLDWGFGLSFLMVYSLLKMKLFWINISGL